MSTIVTISNRKPDQPYYCWDAFHESLSRFNCEAVVLGFDRPWNGFMTKLRRLREWLHETKQSSYDELLIVCDSWDLVFASSPESIANKFLREHPVTEIIFNAEKTLFPPSGFFFPKTGTPYRYLNSGFSIGWHTSYLEAIEKMNIDSLPDDYVDNDGRHICPGDQECWQKAFIEQNVPMDLDVQAELCQALHEVTPEELDFSGPMIRNTVTGSYPMAFHMNGRKETWRDQILSKLNLPG